MDPVANPIKKQTQQLILNPVANPVKKQIQQHILAPFQFGLVKLQDDCMEEGSININNRTIERFLKTCFDDGYHDEKFTALIDVGLECHIAGRKEIATAIFRQLKELNSLPKNLCEQAGIYYWFLSIKSDINDFVKWFQPIANNPNRPIAACFFAKAILDHGQTVHNLNVAIRYFDKSATNGYLPANERLYKASITLNSLENPESTSQHQFKLDAILGKSKFDHRTMDKEITPKRKKTSLPDLNSIAKDDTKQPVDHPIKQPNSSLIRSSSSPADLDRPKDDISQLTVAPPPPKKKFHFPTRGHSNSVNAVPDSVQQKRDKQTTALNPPQAPATRSASNSPPGVKVMPIIKEENSEESSF